MNRCMVRSLRPDPCAPELASHALGGSSHTPDPGHPQRCLAKPPVAHWYPAPLGCHAIDSKIPNMGRGLDTDTPMCQGVSEPAR
eukprot:11737987-Alexandrium_andersonii.AAC.1